MRTYIFEVGGRRYSVQSPNRSDAWAAINRFAPLAWVELRQTYGSTPLVVEHR